VRPTSIGELGRKREKNGKAYIKPLIPNQKVFFWLRIEGTYYIYLELASFSPDFIILTIS
jgi:hypothetical protein